MADETCSKCTGSGRVDYDCGDSTYGRDLVPCSRCGGRGDLPAPDPLGPSEQNGNPACICGHSYGHHWANGGECPEDCPAAWEYECLRCGHIGSAPVDHWCWACNGCGATVQRAEKGAA